MARPTKISFYDWCIKNNRQDILDRWDYELNECSPKEINSITSKKYYLKCQNHLHNSELFAIGMVYKYPLSPFYCKQCNSFYNWCVENNRQDLLDRWDYELNDCIPQNVTYGSDKNFYFICPKHLHKSELYKISTITKDNTKVLCKACNSFAQWGINNICKDFLKKYWDYDKNIGIDPWKIENQSNKTIWIYCQEKSYHESYQTKCSSFYKGCRCSYCTGIKTHKLDSLGYLYPNSLMYWSNKNIKSPYEYSPKSNKKVFWKCLDGKHDDYKRDIVHSLKYNFRCPDCAREKSYSYIQEKVELYLSQLGYSSIHEYNCTLIPQNPKMKNQDGSINKHGQLPFDNEIIINNKHLIIEVHGIQHYELDGYHKLQAKRNQTNPEYELHKQKLYDRYKKYVAFYNKYEYLVIPYWTEKDESYKQLIDDKINFIKEKDIKSNE